MATKPNPRDSPVEGLRTTRASITRPYFSNLRSSSCSAHKSPFEVCSRYFLHPLPKHEGKDDLRLSLGLHAGHEYF